MLNIKTVWLGLENMVLLCTEVVLTFEDSIKLTVATIKDIVNYCDLNEEVFISSTCN